MARIGVYKITSPNKRVYVGSSINIKRRWKEYKRKDCKSQTKLYNSFKKYGIDKHKFEIITECDVKDLLAMELHWGLFYNVLDRKAGLNSQLPKNGEEYQVVSEETKAKISAAFKGKPNGRKGIKTGKPAWNKGKKMTTKHPMLGKKHRQESIDKMRKSSTGQISWNKGKQMPNEVREKISASLKGKTTWNKGQKWSEETKKKMSESSIGCIAWNRKIVLDIQTGVYYNSSTEAAKYNRFSRQSINNMLDGKTFNKTNLIYA